MLKARGVRTVVASDYSPGRRALATACGADVVVNPARFNEPFGRVPFEAGIAGTAAVVTRVGAIPELLRNGESALIVEPEDPTGLAQAVIRMLIDAELRQRLAAGAARVATERLTPQQSLAGFQRAVRAALRPRA